MKTVFLDIDGVLHSLGGSERGFIKLPILEHIKDKVDFEVVISSDWQYSYSLEELQEMFSTLNVVGCTTEQSKVHHLKDDFKKTRTHMIIDYIDKHNLKIEDCVVLDDNPGLGFLEFEFLPEKPNGNFQIKEDVKKEDVNYFASKALRYDDNLCLIENFPITSEKWNSDREYEKKVRTLLKRFYQTNGVYGLMKEDIGPIIKLLSE